MEAARTDKRRRIVQAAVRTFAAKGYHQTRVSDIAREAGVAYGLVYHYFRNKEEILSAIFVENWSVFLEVLKMVEKDNADLRGKIDSICSFLLETYRHQPHLMEVIILEVTRSPKFMERQNLALFREAFAILGRILQRERRRGTVRRDLDLGVACYMLLGAVETILSGTVLGLLDLGDGKSAHRVRRTLVDLLVSGLSA